MTQPSICFPPFRPDRKPSGILGATGRDERRIAATPGSSPTNLRPLGFVSSIHSKVIGRQAPSARCYSGVDLLRHSPRGVTLTAEGKLFLEEVRELLKRADESVEKVRALARGEIRRVACRVRPGSHGRDIATS